MLGTTVLIPTALVPQMGGGNVRRKFLNYDMEVERYDNPAKINCIEKYFIRCLQAEKARVIETLLFVAGINTLVQTLFGSRLPAVIGGSYTYVATTISIILAGRFSGEPDPIEVVLEELTILNDAWLICLVYHFVFKRHFKSK